MQHGTERVGGAVNLAFEKALSLQAGAAAAMYSSALHTTGVVAPGVRRADGIRRAPGISSERNRAQSRG
jgi:hypothetical protein